jgi:hypothetical protein
LETAGLRNVCQAVKALVREWPVNVGDHLFWDVEIESPETLEAVLTCFPATESLTVGFKEPLAPAEESRLVELLRGHGGTVKRVVVTRCARGTELLSSAVQAGALPHLTRFDFGLYDPIKREILSAGMLRRLEEVTVSIDMGCSEQAAALEHLRRLKHLRSLQLTCYTRRRVAFPFPSFIPASLKTLDLLVVPTGLLNSLLRQLPSVLWAGGATLEAIKLDRMELPYNEWGAALAQVLRSCSYTLKGLEFEEQKERMSPATRSKSCTAPGPSSAPSPPPVPPSRA